MNEARTEIQWTGNPKYIRQSHHDLNKIVQVLTILHWTLSTEVYLKFSLKMEVESNAKMAWISNAVHLKHFRRQNTI
jgi:hypothetical protein